MFVAPVPERDMVCDLRHKNAVVKYMKNNYYEIEEDRFCSNSFLEHDASLF